MTEIAAIPGEFVTEGELADQTEAIVPASLLEGVQDQARVMYVEEHKDLPAIAKELRVTLPDLLRRAKANNWPQERALVAQAMMKDADSALTLFQASALLPTADRHLELAKVVEEKLYIAAKAVDPALDDKAIAKLSSIARSMSFVTPVSAKASGLEARSSQDAQEQACKGITKQPLIQIGFKVQMARDTDSGKTIEVLPQ